MKDNVSRSIEYEVNMLSYTASHIGLTSDTQLNNALLESFLIHARVLIEFFYPTAMTKEKGGLYASRYLDRWDDIRPKNPLIMEKEKIHQWLAHLAQSRIDEQKPEWNIGHIHNELKSLMKLFHDNLEPKDKSHIKTMEVRISEKSTYCSGDTVSKSTYVSDHLKGTKWQ